MSLKAMNKERVLKDIENAVVSCISPGGMNTSNDIAKTVEDQILLFIKQWFPDVKEHIELAVEYNPDTGMVYMDARSKGTLGGDLIVGLLKSAQEQ